MSETYDLPGAQAGPADTVSYFPEPSEPAEHAEGPEPVDPAGPVEPVRQDAAVAGTDRVPEPLGVTVGATGNADVDAAVERLSDADALPTDAHVEVYEDVHRGLRDTLTALDENRG